MERAARVPIHIDHVFFGERPENIEVKVRVARLKRVVTPGGTPDTAFEQELALIRLQSPPEATPVRLRSDGSMSDQ